MPRDAVFVIVVRLYTRPGCHLCDVMKATLEQVAASSSTPVEIEQIDISIDADLEARYGLEIPVLEIKGKKVAKYRITEEALKRVLAGAAGGAG
ncbi:MAG TPA: glutaredoxin family protein [Vicinamibacterales bacterium]